MKLLKRVSMLGVLSAFALLFLTGCGDGDSSDQLGLGGTLDDGALDAVFANYEQNNRVCLGDGAGGFTDCSDVSSGKQYSFGVALAPAAPLSAVDYEGD